jgi:hypothetical protein
MQLSQVVVGPVPWLGSTSAKIGLAISLNQFQAETMATLLTGYHHGEQAVAILHCILTSAGLLRFLIIFILINVGKIKNILHLDVPCKSGFQE